MKRLLAFVLTLMLAMTMGMTLVGCGETPESGGEEAVAKDVQLVETGYSLSEENYLTFAFVINNPTEDTAFEFTDITVTAYDENGDVLATGDQMMNKIQPGETQTFASILDCNGQKPDKVEFDIDSGEEMSPADDAIKSSDLEISGTNERNDEYGETSITGNIKNNAAIDTESVAVTVLFKKDGKIVSGSTDFVDNLGAGKEKAFEIIEYDVPEHDSYEVLGLDWGF